MNQPTPTDPDKVWQHVVEAIYSGNDVPKEFFQQEVNRTNILRRAFTVSKREISAALYVMSRLPAGELTPLFSELIHSSTSHSFAGAAREIILTLPREFVLANIEQTAEEHLASGTYDKYRRFLELYVLLDKNLTKRLVERALDHPDEDVREAGEEFRKIILSSE